MTNAVTPKEKDLSQFDAELVYEYLSDNPDFFERYPDLLANLRLPHQQRGTVSIVERQQEALRNKIVRLEEEITALMNIASQNERILRFNTELAFKLMTCEDFDSLRRLLADELKAEFSFTNVRLITVHNIEDEVMQIWKNRMHSGFYLGRLTQNESQKLFGSQVGSVALSRLTPDSECERIILAVASPNAAHFQPEMDTLFLEQLCKLLNFKLSQF